MRVRATYPVPVRPLSVDLGEARSLFAEQARQFVDVCAGLSDLELLDPSRCRGWSRLEVVAHVRDGMDELAATLGVPTDRAPDHDAAGYWDSHPDDRDDDPVPHILHLRRTASAYARPSGAVRHLADATTRAAAVVSDTPDRVVLFQDKSMTTADVIATWVVELAIHLLDLRVRHAPVPAGAALALRTLEAIAESDVPKGLGTQEALLAALGREPWPLDAPAPAGFPVSL